MTSMLHPGEEINLKELERRVKSIEVSDNRYAMRGGLAVTYDSTGRISALNATYISVGTLDGGIINANSINGSSIKSTEIDTGHLKAGAVTASKIAANTITASQIASNTITASEIAANAITASELAANSVTASKILAGEITADKLNVSSLSAITADLGTVTAGILTGVTRVSIGASSAQPFYCYGVSISTSGHIDMNGGDISEVDVISFNSRSSSPGDTWAIYAYDNGGTEEIRTRVDGSNYRVDQTSV